MPGTDKSDPWVNIKLDVTEHEAAPPNQRVLLKGGARLRLKCARCKEPLHVAAEKNAKETLEEAGYHFREGHEYCGLDEKVIACVCANGHVVQLRQEFVERLVEGA